MMEGGFCDIRKLVELLKPPRDDSDSDDEIPRSSVSRLGPGQVGVTKDGASTSKHADKVEEEIKQNQIWTVSEVPEKEDCDVTTDPREKPEYSIRYRQAVTPEDLFLQMGLKTTSTASCEDLVLEVRLLGEDRSRVDLSVERQRVDIRSPRYRLSVPLPHPVDPNHGHAQWDDGTLTITLRMDREFDFVNF